MDNHQPVMIHIGVMNNPKEVILKHQMPMDNLQVIPLQVMDNHQLPMYNHQLPMDRHQLPMDKCQEVMDNLTPLNNALPMQTAQNPRGVDKVFVLLFNR